MKVVLRRKAQKYLDSLDRNTIMRIDSAIEGLSKEPPIGDIKKLRGSSLHRLRVGGYRLTFLVTDTEIIIDKIAPRGDIYKGLRK